MKTNITCLTLLTALLLASCKPEGIIPEESVHLRIIIDKTDPSTLLPDSIEVLSALGLQDHRGNSARVGLTVITDMELNPVEDFELADVESSARNNKSSDLHYRDKEIANFYSQVLAALRKINVPTDSAQSLQFSECFKTLCDQLSVLNDDTTKGRKVLWVFSDMMEKSLLYNAYTKPVTDTTQQKLVKKLFIKTNLLPKKLNGISVYFFYYPENRNWDIKFNGIINVFLDLLEERGANVFIQATNKVLNNE